MRQMSAAVPARLRAGRAHMPDRFGPVGTPPHLPRPQNADGIG